MRYLVMDHLEQAAHYLPDDPRVHELAGRWRDLGGGRRLVEVLQQQPDVVFHLAVPVAVHTADGVQRISVLLDGPLGRREITTTAPIDSVVVDPDLTLLRRTSTTPAPRVLAVQPRPNPARDRVDLAFWLAADDLVDGRVYDVRGRLVRQVVKHMLDERTSLYDPTLSLPSKKPATPPAQGLLLGRVQVSAPAQALLPVADIDFSPRRAGARFWWFRCWDRCS